MASVLQREMLHQLSVLAFVWKCVKEAGSVNIRGFS